MTAPAFLQALRRSICAWIASAGNSVGHDLRAPPTVGKAVDSRACSNCGRSERPTALLGGSARAIDLYEVGSVGQLTWLKQRNGGHTFPEGRESVSGDTLQKHWHVRKGRFRWTPAENFRRQLREARGLPDLEGRKSRRQLAETGHPCNMRRRGRDCILHGLHELAQCVLASPSQRQQNC